jgi:hypothetical protein
MNEVWHARNGIIAHGRARSWRRGSGRRIRGNAWKRLPDPHPPQGQIYPLAWPIAIGVCAFTAAGNDRFFCVYGR